MRSRTRARRPAALLAAAVLPLLFALSSLSLAACNQTRAIREQALKDSHVVVFNAIDGVRLSGRRFGPDQARTGVVLAHMLPADQTSWFEMGDLLGGMGYAVLTFDFRGYCPGGVAGCSDGSKDPAAASRDVAGAVAFLRSQGVRTIALFGASLGGTASLVVSSQPGESIAAVATLSAPRSIGGLVASPDVLAGISAAKLFIAGDADAIAAADAQAMFDEGPQPKDLQILTSGDHGTDLLEGNQSENVRTLLITFLEVHAPA